MDYNKFFYEKKFLFGQRIIKVVSEPKAKNLKGGV